jgi:hypothetical protein
VPSRSLLHADRAALPPPRAGHFRPGVAATNAALARALAHAGDGGDFAGPAARDAVLGYARRAAALGASPTEVASTVRRSLAAAAPGAMTVVAFETIARALVRHALLSLLDD